MKSNTSTALETKSGPTPDSAAGLVHPPTDGDSPRIENVPPDGPGLLRRIWDRWMKVAEVIGTVQMIIILSILYWLVLPLMAIPFKLLSDPLKIKRPSQSNWREKQRDESISTLDSMNNQY